jgi:hypothetical protein
MTLFGGRRAHTLLPGQPGTYFLRPDGRGNRQVNSVNSPSRTGRHGLTYEQLEKYGERMRLFDEFVISQSTVRLPISLWASSRGPVRTDAEERAREHLVKLIAVG